MATNRKQVKAKIYYFIDIDPFSRHIVSWDCAPQGTLDGNLGNGLYRVFLSKGQYNKLVNQLTAARG